MFGISQKAVSLANVSKMSTRWRLSSAADADVMEAVAVAHKGIVESAITWFSETSNLANFEMQHKLCYHWHQSLHLQFHPHA